MPWANLHRVPDSVSDDEAVFDSDISIDCGALEPQITWGTDPGQAFGIGERVPDPASVPADRRAALERAIAYMGLTPGAPIEGLDVHRVFIGSCTNARLPDLQVAANIVRGRKVAEGIYALVVPGSAKVLPVSSTRICMGVSGHSDGSSSEANVMGS